MGTSSKACWDYPATLPAPALQVLSGELKRVKQRAHEQEATVAAQERQLCALRAEVSRLQQAVKDCSVSPQGLLQDEQFKQQLQQRSAGAWDTHSHHCPPSTLCMPAKCALVRTMRAVQGPHNPPAPSKS